MERARPASYSIDPVSLRVASFFGFSSANHCPVEQPPPPPPPYRQLAPKRAQRGPKRSQQPRAPRPGSGLPAAEPASSSPAPGPVPAASLPNDMDHTAHMAAIRELDLSACHPNSIADRINAVPGIKTSAAFFTFLRANLVLPPSAMSSNVSTPLLEPSASQTLPPPSPSPLAKQETTNDDIPPLSLEVLTTQDDKVAAYKLVADSVAQQRQRASTNLVFHPACLAVLTVALGAAWQQTYMKRGDLGGFMILFSGISMTYLLAIRYASAGYLQVAEALKWDWLVAEDGEEDVIIGTRFGEEIIGALVLRLEPNPTLVAKKKSRALSLKGGKGVIRAWTVRIRYRGKGVGADMLHEAVRVTREKCGKDAEVGFAKEHVNSSMILPEIFNGPFRKDEQRAAKALENVLAQWEGNRRKR